MDDAYLHWYVAEIDQVPPLSRAEGLGCVQHIRVRDALAESVGERLLEAHLHLVVPIAKRHQTRQIPTGELIMVGNQALLGALRTFIDSSEDSFPALAVPLIERAIAEAVASPESAGIPGCYFHRLPVS